MKYAISYLMKLMSTLLQYNQESYSELSRLIIKTAIKTYDLDKKDITCFHDKSCAQIRKEMQEKVEEDARKEQEQMEEEAANRARAGQAVKAAPEKAQKQVVVDDGIADVEHNRSIGSHDDEHEDEEEKEEEHDD